MAGVTIDLHAGEVVGVVGGNGAGKSTLMRTLSGARPPDSGQILVNGQPVAIGNPRDAKALGIETIYQTLALADNLDAPANVFLGRELTGAGSLNDAAMDGFMILHRVASDGASARWTARDLNNAAKRLLKIGAAGARPLLFLTWGYRNGDRRNLPDDTFAAMQTRLYSGYWDAARSTGAAIAPVGLAWSEAVASRPQLDLWASDGKHPSRLGSYLAACVFYATLTGRSPVGDTFTDGLNESDARFLQSVAWDIARKQS